MSLSIWLHGVSNFTGKGKPKKSKGKLPLLVERLDERCLLSIYNPVAATGFDPPAVQGVPIANAVLGTVLCADPITDVVGSVSFNGGPMQAVGAVVMVGYEYVPSLGRVPEYSLTAASYTPTTYGPGALTFQLDVSDTADGSTAVAYGSVDVAPALLQTDGILPFVKATTGLPMVNLALAEFADSAENTADSVFDFKGTIDWGDGSPISAASITSVGAGIFQLSGSHTYQKAQTIAGGIAITVQDLNSGQGFSEQTGPVTISDPFVFDSSPSVSGTVGSPLTNVQVAQFTDPNTMSKPSDFQATVTNWGDGSTDSATTIVETSVDGTGAHFAVSASHTYLAALPAVSNITVQVQNVAASPLPLSTTTPVSVIPARQLTGLEPFVNALYLQELGRSGSNSELDSWLPLLHQPGGQAAVANDIATSAEARDYLVKGWYLTYLGRPAAGNEEQVWVKDLLAGETEEQTLSAILGSTEFLNHAQTVIATGTSQERLVEAFYKLLLNRTGSATEVSSWVAALPQLGQQAVAAQFLATPEYRTDLVQGYYTALLDRTAEQAGLEFWESSNLDATMIRDGIESSNEFLLDTLS
ncbi:MAG TPA: hypothetical protein VK395_13795 [Gemmataceae bacterium]|nr:hypothetical protein [Gemmataceae bacterium]